MMSTNPKITRIADSDSRSQRLFVPRCFRRAVGPGRRGAAAVEFAVVAPVFILMIFGMIEIGRAVMVQQVITNAAREGARAAILDGATSTAVTASVNTYLNNASLPTASVTYPKGLPQDRKFGDPVEVEVSLNYSQVSWLPVPRYLSTKALTASSVMRRETN